MSGYASLNGYTKYEVMQFVRTIASIRSERVLVMGPRRISLHSFLLSFCMYSQMPLDCCLFKVSHTNPLLQLFRITLSGRLA